GNKGRQLPKFGEWDATNPASAQGFTVIFNQARDDKKTKKTAVAGPESLVTPPVNIEPQRRHNHHNNKRNPQIQREKVPSSFHPQNQILTKKESRLLTDISFFSVLQKGWLCFR
ncbi:unnamed protein product, partial [Brassica rapa]